MVKGVGVGHKPVHYIPSLRIKLCLRARFFAPLENDSARRCNPYALFRAYKQSLISNTTTPRGQTCWYGLKAVKHIPSLRNRLCLALPPSRLRVPPPPKGNVVNLKLPPLREARRFASHDACRFTAQWYRRGAAVMRVVSSTLLCNTLRKKISAFYNAEIFK